MLCGRTCVCARNPPNRPILPFVQAYKNTPEKSWIFYIKLLPRFPLFP